MSRNYEETLFRYIDSAVRYMKIQPMMLGGVAGSGGGVGGNPGGFIGYLPQTRVAYDESELEIDTTPFSGMSLLDNLNHIRYRMASLEAVTSGGVNVSEDGLSVLLGARTLNFVDAFDVTISDVGEVTIAPAVSGELSDTVYSGVYGEEFYISTSGTQQFTVANDFDPSSLSVYWNGQRISNTDFTVIDSNSFSVDITVLASGDTISTDYQVPHGGYFHSHHQYLASGDTFSRDEITYFLSTKANNPHTHVEADITDLSHDAVSIQGVPVASGIGPVDYQILQFSELTGKFELVTAEFEQQILFSIGEGGLADTGVKPYRVYTHDVGQNAELTKVFAYVGTAPSADMEFDILKNGTAVATVVIGAGANSGFTTAFVSNLIEEDDYFQIQIITGNATADYLTVHVRFIRRFN